MGFFNFPSPAKMLVPPKPPLPPFAPPLAKSVNNTVHAFLSAPIKSTIAADPLLAWAQTGKWQNHGDRTAAGVHELYKEDRIAQALGVKESDVVKVVNVVAVVVVIYFGGAFLGAWGGSGTAAAGAGTAATGAGVAGAGTGTAVAAGGVTVAGVMEGVAAVGTVAGMVPQKQTKPALIGGEKVAGPKAPKELTEPEHSSAGGLTLAGALLGLGAIFIF